MICGAIQGTPYVTGRSEIGLLAELLTTAGFFSFGLLDRLQVCLHRPHLREAPAGFGLGRFATAFTNNPG